MLQSTVLSSHRHRHRALTRDSIIKIVTEIQKKTNTSHAHRGQHKTVSKREKKNAFSFDFWRQKI